MKLSPLMQYQADLKQPGFVSDPAQATAMTALNAVYLTVLARQSLWQRLLNTLLRRKPMTRGVYLWGPVGSGKTYLMDTFYHCLPSGVAKRIHFHEFMRQVHAQLKLLQGERDPLKRVAYDFAEQAHVICFDEFFVDDIGDAMILGGLLRHLFNKGVILVATSNIALEELYKDGLQRERFLPTIALLQQYCQAVRVCNRSDYRLREAAVIGSYFTPLNAQAEQAMQQCFTSVAIEATSTDHVLQINHREFSIKQSAPGVLWVTFAELCQKPRNAADYLALAHLFHTVLISDVPVMANQDNNIAKRFIFAVDVFYDQQIRLVISAAASIDNLYTGQLLADKFQRTASRLHEMQSEEYLEKVIARKPGTHQDEFENGVDLQL